MNVRSVCATLLFLFSVGFATNCQWVYDPDVVDYPVGIGRCNYVEVTVGNRQGTYSFSYQCTSASSVAMTKFTESVTCSGTATTSDVTDEVSAFQCSSDYAQCGKAFGWKTPCDCTAADSNCDQAISVSLVDEICLYSSSSSYSYMWQIQCGSISSANAQQFQYANTQCADNPSETYRYDAGCQQGNNINNQTDWIICPGNQSTFSVVVLVIALIASILFWDSKRCL